MFSFSKNHKRKSSLRWSDFQANIQFKNSFSGVVIPLDTAVFPSVSLCSKWSGQPACSLRHLYHAVIHNKLSGARKLGVYISSCNVLRPLERTRGKHFSSGHWWLYPAEEFHMSAVFCAFLGLIYSGWGQGSSGMWGGCLQRSHVNATGHTGVIVILYPNLHVHDNSSLIMSCKKGVPFSNCC